MAIFELMLYMDSPSEGVDSVHKLCNVWSDPPPSPCNEKNVFRNSPPPPRPKLHYIINKWSLILTLGTINPKTVVLSFSKAFTPSNIQYIL